MKYIILLLLLLFSNILASQSCKTEAQIPSSTPDSFFVDNGNGTISDNSTGLMWQKCQVGLSGSTCTVGSPLEYSWENSLNEAFSNSLADYNDWRLPNIKELMSIVEERCSSPSINSNYFPNMQSSWFWSATPNISSDNGTWGIEFSFGNFASVDRSSLRYIRLVRFE